MIKHSSDNPEWSQGQSMSIHGSYGFSEIWHEYTASEHEAPQPDWLPAKLRKSCQLGPGVAWYTSRRFSISSSCLGFTILVSHLLPVYIHLFNQSGFENYSSTVMFSWVGFHITIFVGNVIHRGPLANLAMFQLAKLGCPYQKECPGSNSVEFSTSCSWYNPRKCYCRYHGVSQLLIEDDPFSLGGLGSTSSGIFLKHFPSVFGHISPCYFCVKSAQSQLLYSPLFHISVSCYVVFAHAAVQLAIDLRCEWEMPGGLRPKKPFMRHQEVVNGIVCDWGAALPDTYEDRGSAE